MAAAMFGRLSLNHQPTHHPPTTRLTSCQGLTIRPKPTLLTSSAAAAVSAMRSKAFMFRQQRRNRTPEAAATLAWPPHTAWRPAVCLQPSQAKKYAAGTQPERRSMIYVHSLNPSYQEEPLPLSTHIRTNRHHNGLGRGRQASSTEGPHSPHTHCAQAVGASVMQLVKRARRIRAQGMQLERRVNGEM